VLNSPTGGADAIKLRWAMSPPPGYRRPNFLVRDGAGMRLVAAMAEPWRAEAGRRLVQPAGAESRISPFTEEPTESDAQYFRRRSMEEEQAAAEAAGPEARAAHLDLARRYARLSARKTWPHRVGFARREHLSGLLIRRFVLPDGRGAEGAIVQEPVAERKRRLDGRLDEALLETFPASDPVSFVHIS
jgi:hypothetical protein